MGPAADCSGWTRAGGWTAVSLAPYARTGVCWLPVGRIQIIRRALAAEAARNGTALPPRYHRLARLWVALGILAFAAVLAILWLMIARPGF